MKFIFHCLILRIIAVIHLCQNEVTKKSLNCLQFKLLAVNIYPKLAACERLAKKTLNFRAILRQN